MRWTLALVTISLTMMTVPAQASQECVTASGMINAQFCAEWDDTELGTVIVPVGDPYDGGGASTMCLTLACWIDEVDDNTVTIFDAWMTPVEVTWDINNGCALGACYNVEDLWACLTVESPIPCPPQPDEGAVSTAYLYDMTGNGNYEGIAVKVGSEYVGIDFGCGHLNPNNPLNVLACPL